MPVVTEGYGAISSMSRSAANTPHFGRAEYTFESPPFVYDPEPEYLISTFPGDSFNAAQNIVDLFNLAKETCERVKKDIDDFVGYLRLPGFAPLSTCLQQIKSKHNVNVEIVHEQPPKARITSHLVPPDVMSACEKLNNALNLSFQFTRNEKHTQLDNDLHLVKSFKDETALLQKAFHELQKYEKYIGNVKKQTDCFISDFLYSSN